MILVTGGTGLIGSHLLLELAKQGNTIRAIKRNSSSLGQVEHVFKTYNAQHLLKNIEWLDGDITDIYSIAEALCNVKQVYHCAGIVSFKASDEKLLLKINAEGTANVVNACIDAGIEKLCHVSSVSVLNNSIAGQEITEKIFWKSSPNNSIYSISKYNAEREAWRAMEEGLNVVIVNPSVVIGAGVLSGGSCEMLAKAKRGNMFYTNGETGFVDAIDVAKTMIALMDGDFKNDRYIISGHNVTYKDFFTIANKAFGKKPPGIYAGKFITEVGWRVLKLLAIISGTNPVITKEVARAAHNRKKYSNKKITTLLNYSFAPFKESLERACKNFKPL